MRTRMAVLGAAGMTIVLAGCASNPAGMVMTGGKMAVRVIEGAEAKIRPLEDASPAVLAAYRSIRLGEVTTDVPALISPAQISTIRSETSKEFAAESTRKHFPGGEKTLAVNLQCRFLKERGTFGGEARLDMIAVLMDAGSGEEIARLFIEGLSESPLAGKTEHMAQANASELVDYLVKRRAADKK